MSTKPIVVSVRKADGTEIKDAFVAARSWLKELPRPNDELQVFHVYRSWFKNRNRLYVNFDITNKRDRERGKGLVLSGDFSSGDTLTVTHVRPA